MESLSGKRVVLGVTGGIAAYKAAELCRLLVKAGASVRVIMTRAACAFVAPLTFQALSGHRVATDIFDLTQESEIGHIKLADEADVVVVAPATADAIARISAGMGDDLLTTVILATRAPVLLAPAMNVNMWNNPIVQENLRRMIEVGGMRTVGPDRGVLACGWVGEGRLVEPDLIVAEVIAVLGKTTGPMKGLRVVVTAGPTEEPLDDVRFLGNRSSGKMGFAMARAAADAGASVTLIAGPVALATPQGVRERIDVRTALEMEAAVRTAAEDVDVVVMSAAVADFRPAAYVAGKLSRREHGQGSMKIDLVSNPDLLKGLGLNRKGRRPLLVGFAAEIGVSASVLVERAAMKLEEKRCDVVVANDVGQPGIGFGSDKNQVTLVFSDGRTVSLGPATKKEIADQIWTKLGPPMFALRDDELALRRSQ